MKSFFTIFILAVLIVASTFTMISAQNAWDGQFVGMPSVIFENNIYHMWYTGNSPEPIGSIGYASSVDGITWTKYSRNPILVDEPYGGWNEQTVYEPSVIFQDSIFHMWYASSNDPQLPGPIHIHHATSSDGLSWVRDTLNNPVLSPGSNGSWDDVLIDSHCIIFTDSLFHMWYMGWNGTANQVRLGHATSANGISWTKDANNPVLSYGTAGSWDYPRVEAPNVVFDGNMYHMWYSGGNHSGWRIGYATSPHPDSAWTKYSGNPVLNLGTLAKWDDTYVGFCSVLLDTTIKPEEYKMWYTGGDISLFNQSPWSVVGQIGYATSLDGITWTKIPNPVLTDINDENYASMPEMYTLSQNYPNPFQSNNNYRILNSKIRICYTKNLQSTWAGSCYLVSEKLTAGNYKYTWDAGTLASGIYLYKLQAGKFVKTQKMVLLR